MRDETRTRKILPVDLMLEGRRCLVVGGGTIATRKVGHLLDAGAQVTVVSAAVLPELRRRIAAGQVEHRNREFRDADVKGRCLVIAATDNGSVNACVVRLCRRAGILCASADEHWMDGDFLTPATLRQPGLILTISTGGESCRRSRLVKDYLARHLDRLDGADLVIWEADGRVPAGLGVALAQVWGIREFAILELPACYAVLAVASREPGVTRLVNGLLGRRGGPRVKRGVAALRRTAALAADAKVMDRSLRRGIAAGWAGVVVQDWIATVFRFGEIKGWSRECRQQYERIIRGL